LNFDTEPVASTKVTIKTIALLNPKLQVLLDANASFALAARGTTNHCPMALIALDRMGATPERLQAFFDMWKREYAVSASPVDTTISRHAWLNHVGDGKAFGVLRACFLEWIVDDGYVSVVSTVLEGIPFAPATLAFHALIRLAYGIEAEHAGEIASGLAALVSSHFPIKVDVDVARRAQSVRSGFTEAVSTMKGGVFQGNSITARLRAVAMDPRFAIAVRAPPPCPSLLDELARTTIGAYWQTPDFTLLHTVTATRAARIVFSCLSDALVERLSLPLWIALCAAYVTVGLPPAGENETPKGAIDWQRLRELAVASDDDHVIKMAYTCFCEDMREPSPLYAASTARFFQ
jgi:hypothetical protein